MKRLGNKGLPSHDLGKFEVHGFFCIAVRIDDRWRSAQDQRIAKRESVSVNLY